ncbi:hypothetical protein [Methylocella sp.]|uniref:hypothetical protein n=1 Tax=Methylocella sp. TaxID=1978226 RepID=UPI0037835CEE
MAKTFIESVVRAALLAAFCALCGVATGFAPAAAADDLTLACPSSGEPALVDGGGRRRAIVDPADRAIAAKACDPDLAAGAPGVSVLVANSGAATLYVAFTNYATQKPGPIVWAANCLRGLVNQQMAIPPGASCAATVPATAGTTRFCASATPVPAGRLPNCNLAQARNQTMVETTFGAGANGCYPTSMASCVWYDVSVIPQNCTADGWTLNRCANAGGASYNLPVALSCVGQPTYVCQGPRGGTYGSANYPVKCGNPNARCVGGGQSCDNAYFFPTPIPQPNSQCPAGQVLKINFLAGP